MIRINSFRTLQIHSFATLCFLNAYEVVPAALVAKFEEDDIHYLDKDVEFGKFAMDDTLIIAPLTEDGVLMALTATGKAYTEGCKLSKEHYSEEKIALFEEYLRAILRMEADKEKPLAIMQFASALEGDQRTEELLTHRLRSPESALK